MWSAPPIRHTKAIKKEPGAALLNMSVASSTACLMMMWVIVSSNAAIMQLDLPSRFVDKYTQFYYFMLESINFMSHFA